MAQIELKNVTKGFDDITALDNISLKIEQGEIFGIIGMSGAGKSTLVRCLNYLEKPTSGEVVIEGEQFSLLSERELRDRRKNIAMIFQHFNLLMQRTVLDNVAFPLLIQGVSKRDARKKAREYLKEVGLSEKEKSYPSKLSGGQKQRVAIARALASNPHILLCDEATSALDPQTTASILELLKDINTRYGITIVMITHQMEVIQKICDKVAIIEKGKLAEEGTVLDVFKAPKSAAGQRLILGDGLNEAKELKELPEESRLRVVFETNSTYEPVIANMILYLGEPVNILHANTRDVNGTAKGEMILGVSEKQKELIKQYLQERNLTVSEVSCDVDKTSE
ncbi:MAG: ATP-binding cassette domain-containing protein [Cellulosilyticum sp.]|nr:ATP-binding cassette domain-containing protein [Cellulosilyticum sp.]